jgi:hypothetical protein
MMKKPIGATTTVPSYQNYQTPLPISSLPSSIPTLPNFTKQFIAESPVKNQIVAKNF